jgi:hypothetical protein
MLRLAFVAIAAASASFSAAVSPRSGRQLHPNANGHENEWWKSFAVPGAGRVSCMVETGTERLVLDEEGGLISFEKGKQQARNAQKQQCFGTDDVRQLRHGAAWKAWAQHSASGASSGNKITRLTVAWKVPPAPATPGGALLYFWPGIEPTDNGAVLQPVLQFGSSPAGGGEYWALANWYVGPLGVHTSDLIKAAPGDIVEGDVRFVGTNNTWTLTGTNTRTRETTVMHFSGGGPYVWAYAAVLEAYGVGSACGEYPSTGVCSFSVVGLEVNGQRIAAPAWKSLTKDNECGEHAVVKNATAVDIVFRH